MRIPFCASACWALLNESDIGACKVRFHQYSIRSAPRCLWSYLGEIHAERVHIQAIQEARKALTEPCQALVHQLQVHEVSLQVRHGIGELRKLRLQGIDGGLVVSGGADAMAIAVGFP